MESIIEYKKSIQERLDNADLLVTKTVNLNAKLESELKNKNQEIEQLRKEVASLKKTNQDLSTKCSQGDEDLEVIKDFFSHMVQVRVQTGSPYEDDQGLWFNISQGNNTISIDYKLGFVKGEVKNDNIGEQKEELSDIDKNKNTTEIIYVPLLKELSLDELKLLQEKLPSYMFETLSFPLDALNQFYSKMSKCLNKRTNK
ncbi:Csm1p PWA37_004663 [Arxiozyma heterogenica]|uniref:Monopolin complex subunit Csm1/Pcs1 C-terminal domain-containing protein n=1 Tax=Arxiozyma heterogenica TaxID=278026 RepID=A0AAN7W5P0_9SACH|nr:hypothetical protein RI543_000945 [Kazachstania heterogenica]